MISIDHSIFFADEGVRAVCTPASGGAEMSGMVILDHVSGASEFEGFSAPSTRISMTYLVADFSALNIDDAVVIGGDQYRVRNPMLKGDGVMAVAELGKYQER